MIRSWWSAVTTFHRTHILLKASAAVLALGCYAALLVVAAHRFPEDVPMFGAQLHGLLGIVLGFLLVFRTNTSYDRWWEARKLWGQLVNDSRNLAIKVACCVRTDDQDKHRLARHLADFAWALKGHLQGGLKLRDLSGFRDSSDQPTHVPIYVVRRLYEQLETWRQTDRLDGFEFWVVDLHASSLMNICGACERILKTPIAPSHRRFIRQSIALYLLTLPWGLLDTLNVWVVPVTMLLGYLLIGVELIAETIENPFGHTVDDLSLNEICQGIENSVCEILPAPPPG